MEQLQILQLSLDEFKDLLAEILQQNLQDVTFNQPDQLLSRKEVARRLGISLASIHKYSELGILKPRKIGGRIFYLWSEILKAAIAIEPRNLINSDRE